VVLEITERTWLGDIKDLDGRVERLREMGFRLAVDDLGAGYAGLTSFARLRPDFVKIDQSLIRGIDQDPTRRRLVRSMVRVCGEMGVHAICEGVESAAEQETLAQLGCDLYQGYHFARPGRPFPTVDFSER
jgi:EAL domain-containing protein (putative c-di-GMP-specific phosphodiesterase class I)